MISAPRSRRSAALALGWVCALAVLEAGLAQHGHPLVGSWSGDWGPDAERRSRVLLLLGYDGEAITGAIFSGGARIPLSRATLDPSTWSVVLEAEREDASGNTVDYRIEGSIENLGSARERAIAGTWSEGGVRGDFRVVIN